MLSGTRHGARALPALVLSLAIAVAGCASAPSLPAGFTPEAAQVEAGVGPNPAIVIDGPAGKIGGMFRGLAWGGGIGLLIGLALDTGCSFVCGAAPAAGALLGGGGGLIHGAVVAEREADVEAKRAMLAAAFAAQPYTRQLADALRSGKTETGDPAPWMLTVHIVGLDTIGHGRDEPYGLRLRARLEVRPAGAPAPAVALDFDAPSAAQRPTPEWQADGGRPLRDALDSGVHSLAEQMRTALRQRLAGR